ncbi:glycosyl hydrolase [Luteimicrobium subarcticum]|uniref:Mannan endo-1,4-beta-mannosidase n=1 Tax=Luteimicrobium subarcticum TaxID=620910 RepID=A0A2M8WRP2_9MICO|nr:glycosyl hydrolase [Luteimicrobium subarcticum]PJI93578.1 mannan endo-1,4-beta-mannosidase [Luteimicrobium subarcticum]
MRASRRLLAAGASLAATAALVATSAPSATSFPASSKQQVLDYLTSITGNHVVAGQHNKEPASQPNQYSQVVKNVTGQWPGLWGGDLMFNAADVANRQRVIDQAKSEWANGSLVALTWHVCPPTQGSSCSFDGGVKSRITNTQFDQVVTDGTALNTAWKKRLDEAVPYLQQLKDAGVPVLFRPLHEMNETWNWWGGYGAKSAQLYRITHDYLVGKGLTNLIWVWNVQDNPAGGWSTYYPGSSYVDVVTLDAWYKAYPSASDYQQIQSIAGSKPIAIAEMGTMPTEAFLASQPKWSSFMIWSEQLQGSNTNAAIQSTYFDPRVLYQGKLTLPAAGSGGSGGSTGSARTGAITGLAGKCVDVRSSGTADGTVVQLYTCATGSAQTWTVAAPSGTGTVVNPSSGKCLDVAGQGTADGTAVQLWTCNGSGAQQWTYDASARTLRNPPSGKCLDVTGQSSADSTPLQVWTCNGQTNQVWNLPAA